MALRARKIGDKWIMMNVKTFDEKKYCPCCRELYQGWGQSSHGYFLDNVCDDCFVNVIQPRIDIIAGQKELEDSYNKRMEKVFEYRRFLKESLEEERRTAIIGRREKENK